MTRHSSSSAPRVQIPSPRILMVDDEPALLEGLRRQLRGSFDITTAVGAEAALRVLAIAAPFAIVLSDMRMPGMGGVEFLAVVRRRYPETVRLLLTGQADMQSTIDAINIGQVQRFLLKPCPPDTLRQALLDAVELHRQTSAERDLLMAARAAVHALADSQGTAEPAEASQSGRGRHSPAAEQPRHRSLAERLAEARSTGAGQQAGP